MGRKGSGLGIQWDLSTMGRGHKGTERVGVGSTMGFEHNGTGAQWADPDEAARQDEIDKFFI